MHELSSNVSENRAYDKSYEDQYQTRDIDHSLTAALFRTNLYKLVGENQ